LPDSTCHDHHNGEEEEDGDDDDDDDDDHQGAKVGPQTSFAIASYYTPASPFTE
jgi:hypothetical protein